MGPLSMQTSQVRFEGYKLALQKHKIPVDPALVKVVDFYGGCNIKRYKETTETCLTAYRNFYF